MRAFTFAVSLKGMTVRWDMGYYVQDIIYLDTHVALPK